MSIYKTPLLLENLPGVESHQSSWPWTEQVPLLTERMANGCKWPRISIVTPSYNQGQFLEETIRSVLLQGYPNLEYILIDGGSTDNSLEIIEKYQQYLDYWVSEPDRGPADAINKGWNRATGEIVAYLNSDDVYLPGTLAMISRKFHHKPTASAICGNELAIDSQGMVLRQSNVGQITHQSLMSLHFIPQPATFIRRSTLNQVGSLALEEKYTFDFELWLRLTRTGLIELIPDVLAATRWHDQTITMTRRLEIGRDLAKLVTTEVERFTPKLAPLEKKKLLFSLNTFVIGLHLEKDKFASSIQYASVAFHTAPNLLSRLKLMKMYIEYWRSKYFHFLASPSQIDVGEKYPKVHWSKIAELSLTSN